jgi:hypothetical protein
MKGNEIKTIKEIDFIEIGIGNTFIDDGLILKVIKLSECEACYYNNKACPKNCNCAVNNSLAVVIDKVP